LVSNIKGGTYIEGQNYWGYGICALSGILKTREYIVPDTGSASVLRSREEDVYPLGSLRKT
jgi:hypothetical protein